MNAWYQQQFDKALTTQYDECFAAIEGLTWLPWVGKNYQVTRVLIVAESHYTNAATPEEAQKGKLEYMEDKHSTREVFAEYPMIGYKAGWTNHGGRHNNPTFDNIFRVLVSSDLLSEESRLQREKLCSALGFVNIVQRPMWFPPKESGYPKERPKPEDMINGWKVIKQVLAILKPDLCWFAGSEAAKFLNWYMDQVGLVHDDIHVCEKIGHTYAREVNVLIDGMQIPLKFSQHPSQYFSWESWQKFIFNDRCAIVQQNLLQYMTSR